MLYFEIGEFQRSPTAAKLGIDNTIPIHWCVNLDILVERVLDPAREKFGSPIYVTSGYRCSELNKNVPNSSTRSLHMVGRAADITCKDLKRLPELFKILSGLPHCQLYIKPTFIHVAL